MRWLPTLVILTAIAAVLAPIGSVQADNPRRSWLPAAPPAPVAPTEIDLQVAVGGGFRPDAKLPWGSLGLQWTLPHKFGFGLVVGAVPNMPTSLDCQTWTDTVSKVKRQYCDRARATDPVLRVLVSDRFGNFDAVLGFSALGQDAGLFGRLTVASRGVYARVGLRDGAELPVPREFLRVTVGTMSQDLAPFDVAVALVSWHDDYAFQTETSPIAVRADLGMGFTVGRWRIGTHFGSNAEVSIALGYPVAGKTTPKVVVEELPASEPAPPPSAPIDYTLAFDTLATAGRTLTYATTGLPTPEHRCVLVQRRDYLAAGQPFALLRWTCTDNLPETDATPYTGPLLVRTGCYTLDNSGMWRLPACPDAVTPPGAPRRQLVVPSAKALRQYTDRFPDISRNFIINRTFVVDDRPVQVVCGAKFLPGVAEVCSADGYGILWVKTTDGKTMSLHSTSTTPIDPKAHERFATLSGTDISCSLSSGCTALGFCHAKQDTCVALGDADCEAAWCCPRDGACAAVNGACVAASDVRCGQAEACTTRGRCTAKGGRCVATTTEQCAASLDCLDHGKCALANGACVAPP